MPEQLTLSVIVSIASLCVALYVALRNNKRTDTKDIEERVKSDTRINMKLDEIGRNVNDVKTDLSSVKEDIKAIDTRLVIVEQSTKSAHHRIDSLEGHMEREE